MVADVDVLDRLADIGVALRLAGDRVVPGPGTARVTPALDHLVANHHEDLRRALLDRRRRAICEARRLGGIG